MTTNVELLADSKSSCYMLDAAFVPEIFVSVEHQRPHQVLVWEYAEAFLDHALLIFAKGGPIPFLKTLR